MQHLKALLAIALVFLVLGCITEPPETDEEEPDDSVEEDCKKEGEALSVMPDSDEYCCEGLELIPPKDPEIIGIRGYCTALCGNGKCNDHIESEYNCIVDCGQLEDQDHCQSNSDCDDGDEATNDLCSGTPKQCSNTLKTCSEMGGKNCALDRTCEGTTKESYDNPNCCFGSCIGIDCDEEWTCGMWSECANGIQTRYCSDFHSCGTTLSKPETIIECGTADCTADVGELASEGCDSSCNTCDCTTNNGGNTLSKTAGDWSAKICLSEPGVGYNTWHNAGLVECIEGYIGHFYGFPGPCMCGNEYCGISYSGGDNINHCSQGTCSADESCPVDSECYYEYMRDILNESCEGGEIDMQEGDRHDFSFEGYDYYILVDDIYADYVDGDVYSYIDSGEMGLGLTLTTSNEEKYRFQDRSHKVGVTLEKTYGSLTQNHPNACITIRKIGIE